MGKTVKITRRRITRTRKPANSNGVDARLVAAGALAGAGIGSTSGTYAGIRRANNTRSRIPAAASRIANNSIERYNRANDLSATYGKYERQAEDTAYSGTTNAKDSKFYRTQAAEYRANKVKNAKVAQSINESGRMVPSNNKKIIERKLGRAPEVALARTKKYAKRGAVVGGFSGAALSTLAQLVARELKKKG